MGMAGASSVPHHNSAFERTTEEEKNADCQDQDMDHTARRRRDSSASTRRRCFLPAKRAIGQHTLLAPVHALRRQRPFRCGPAQELPAGVEALVWFEGQGARTGQLRAQAGLRDAESSSANIDVATQIATSLGVLRTLRVQIWRVLEDCMTMRVVQRDTAASATHA
ncbi:hypothetical protein DFH11DRAFT_1637817, partial [Phellopilus nigrolimitatus]